MKRIYMDVLDEVHTLLHDIAKQEGKTGKRLLEDLLKDFARKKSKQQTTKKLEGRR